MEYKIKNVCDSLNIGVSKFYKLKYNLDNSIPEQNRTEYYYKVGRNFYITDKGFEWFKTNINSFSASKTIKNDSSNNITLYQNQIIEIYKQRIEYLENENKRLLDIISIKEQKEIANNIRCLEESNSKSFFNKIFKMFRK